MEIKKKKRYSAALIARASYAKSMPQMRATNSAMMLMQTYLCFHFSNFVSFYAKAI